MIEFQNGGRLVESLDELPNLRNAKLLFSDVETKSFNPKEKALKPHHGHRIAGICITADDHPGAWYVPVRCAWDRWNLPLDNVMAWWRDTIQSADGWVNHNIKFDAHFARYDGVDFNDTKLIDTMTLARLKDSDRFTYGLAALSKDWLKEDIVPYDNVLQAWLKGASTKDYGDIPADVIGEYGCQDIITNRKLYHYIRDHVPEQSSRVWDTEVALTPVLFDMEVAGMRVDDLELKKKELLILTKLLRIEERIHKVTGIATRPHTNPDCFEVLCNKYGLPVLGWTDTGDPSFDKEALTSYLAHPVVRASTEITEVVKLIREYRTLNTLLTFFVRPYQEHQVDGIMHPDYNQCVRTGRMSCRRPNAQQLSPEAKMLVYPHVGDWFLRWDYSQIEFRLIVHYIQDAAAIKAYNENPDIDFHQWVADMCGIPRRPAKNVNFAMGYGGGKKKIVTMLSTNMDLVGSLSETVDRLVATNKIDDSQREAAFAALCLKRGEQVYGEYHQTLPTLRSTSYRASTVCKLRGYVHNAYGRRRHLPTGASYRAFNTIIQSCAGDVMKERLVAVAPRYNREICEAGIRLIACVHDEALMSASPEVCQDKAFLRRIKSTLEKTSIEFRVPIRTAGGYASTNWKDASTNDVDLSE